MVVAVEGEARVTTAPAEDGAGWRRAAAAVPVLAAPALSEHATELAALVALPAE